VYTLSIPNLGISQAIVKYGHTDLKKSLIQYPDTAMPGTLGNTVIFGHSVLPQFFSPTNYVSIFSTLHTLKNGDRVELVYDNTTYTYAIYDMYEVEPEELSPLAQTFDDRRLTIITCTPPGTYLRRLIIRASLVAT
jgi:sortase A